MSPASRELPEGARQQATTAHITSERHTERYRQVGCAGCARYSAYECCRKAEREWYRRGIRAFVS